MAKVKNPHGVPNPPELGEYERRASRWQMVPVLIVALGFLAGFALIVRAVLG